MSEDGKMTDDRTHVIDDLPYARRDDQTLLARIYRSSNVKAGAPAVVDVHPGAWSEGDRTWGRVYDEALASRGFLVVALDFRQAPGFRHPAASADVATGVRWVRSNGQELGIDPARISLVGSSSGGHLALLAACRPDEPEHAGKALRWDGESEIEEDVSAAVSCVAALWPPVDPFTRYGWLLERLENGPSEQRENYKALRRGMDLYFGDRQTMARASVPRVVRDGEATHLPPVWVCYPELDQNVPFWIVQDFEATWRMGGGEIAVSVYPGQSHAFGHTSSEATKRFVDELATFLAVRTKGRH